MVSNQVLFPLFNQDPQMQELLFGQFVMSCRNHEVLLLDKCSYLNEDKTMSYNKLIKIPSIRMGLLCEQYEVVGLKR